VLALLRFCLLVAAAVAVPMVLLAVAVLADICLLQAHICPLVRQQLLLALEVWEELRQQGRVPAIVGKLLG
jgi:hypothetical protein